MGGHHRLLIRVHLDHIAFLDRSAAAVEDEIQAALDAIPAAQGVSADGVRCAGPGPDAAVLPAAERLAEIPGVSLDLARAIIAETGLDMARFPTAAHLVSWAGLSPVTRQSGPRSRKPQKGQGNDYLKGYCTQAATGAASFDGGEVAGIGHAAEVLGSQEERGTRDLPPALEVEQDRPVGIAGQLVADVAGGHKECCREGVGLALHLLQPPDVLAVHDEVPEFVGAVETGSGPVVRTAPRRAAG